VPGGTTSKTIVTFAFTRSRRIKIILPQTKCSIWITRKTMVAKVEAITEIGIMEEIPPKVKSLVLRMNVKGGESKFTLGKWSAAF